jgi:uncharacterized membrane protein YhaH (DUF805 family)
MGGMTLVHWIVVIAILFIVVFPTVKILRKAGYSGWWCLVMFVPVVNWIMLWVFAYASWPNLRPEQH